MTTIVLFATCLLALSALIAKGASLVRPDGTLNRQNRPAAGIEVAIIILFAALSVGFFALSFLVRWPLARWRQRRRPSTRVYAAIFVVIVAAYVAIRFFLLHGISPHIDMSAVLFPATVLFFVWLDEREQYPSRKF